MVSWRSQTPRAKSSARKGWEDWLRGMPRNRSRKLSIGSSRRQLASEASRTTKRYFWSGLLGLRVLDATGCPERSVTGFEHCRCGEVGFPVTCAARLGVWQRPPYSPEAFCTVPGGDGASAHTNGGAGSRPQKIVRGLALLPISRSLGPQPPKQ